MRRRIAFACIPGIVPAYREAVLMEKKSYALAFKDHLEYVSGYVIDSQLELNGEPVEIGIHKGKKGWMITDINTGMALNQVPFELRKDAVTAYYMRYRLPLQKLITAAETDYDAYYARKTRELDERMGVRNHGK